MVWRRGYPSADTGSAAIADYDLKQETVIAW